MGGEGGAAGVGSEGFGVIDCVVERGKRVRAGCVW